MSDGRRDGIGVAVKGGMAMPTAELTREAILAMPAGREMDALVAERVMGWTPKPPYGHWYDADGNPSGYHPEATDCRKWSPSTDIAAAWQVVEKINADPSWKGGTMPRWFAISGPANCGDGRWCAGFQYEICLSGDLWTRDMIEWDEDTCCAGGETAPLAVCRAALLCYLDEKGNAVK
jgi:hypothetical protein